MLESKCVATDRLRREGRWEEASLWRDQKRGELRAEGQTKAKSNEQAWDAMIDKFPPLPPSEVQSRGGGHAVELLDIDPDAYDGQSGCAGDIAWVYQNLSVKSATPHQAPSSGAWALLQWARRNTDKFFPLWARTMPHHAEQDYELCTGQEDPKIRQIGQMIAASKKEGGYECGDIDFSNR